MLLNKIKLRNHKYRHVNLWSEESSPIFIGANTKICMCNVQDLIFQISASTLSYFEEKLWPAS